MVLLSFGCVACVHAYLCLLSLLHVLCFVLWAVLHRPRKKKEAYMDFRFFFTLYGTLWMLVLLLGVLK